MDYAALFELEKKQFVLPTRKDKNFLDETLDEGFVEIVSNGKIYSRSEIIQILTTTEPFFDVIFDNFVARELSERTVLFNYTTRILKEGEVDYNAYRSSIWKKVGQSWKQCFHQITLIAA